MKTIVFVTSQIAPFQVEFAAAMNDIADVRYHVIFTGKENKRPPHWLDLNDKIAKFSSIAPNTSPNENATKDWAIKHVRELNPDAVLIGGVRGMAFNIGQAYRRESRVPVGLWMEPPLRKTNPAHKLLRRIDYKWRLKKVDFIFAIGDRAHHYYRGCNPNTHFVPYGADLKVCLDLPLPKPRGDKTKFLFSGGLHERHNFPVIMAGFKNLLDSRGPCFEIIISGDGPEQKVIDAAIKETPVLGGLIRYERTFSGWSERLNPFLESHVFIYPTNHAGWGLVVPEAMASGNLVISTDGAESARYLISNEINGVFIKPNIEEFSTALLRCIDDREWVENLGLAARFSAKRGHASYVSEQLMNALRIASNGRV